jgi:hypothetical protein
MVKVRRVDGRFCDICDIWFSETELPNVAIKKCGVTSTDVTMTCQDAEDGTANCWRIVQVIVDVSPLSSTWR